MEDNIVKMSVVPNCSVDAMQSQSEYQQTFSETETLIIKYIWKCKQPKILKQS